MRIGFLVLAAAAIAWPAHAQTLRLCRPVEQARPRSAADSARDSVRSAFRDSVQTELMRAARGAGVAEPGGIVLVQRPPDAGAARVWTYRSNVPDSVFAAVGAARADLVARWPNPRVSVMDFRLDPLDLPDSPSMECLPYVMDPEQFSLDLHRMAERFPAQPGASTVVALSVRMLVTRDGEVAYAEASRPSWNAEVDREVVRLAERLRFQPASLGVVPIDVWVTQPVEVLLPDAGRLRTGPE